MFNITPPHYVPTPCTYTTHRTNRLTAAARKRGEDKRETQAAHRLSAEEAKRLRADQLELERLEAEAAEAFKKDKVRSFAGILPKVLSHPTPPHQAHPIPPGLTTPPNL